MYFRVNFRFIKSKYIILSAVIIAMYMVFTSVVLQIWFVSKVKGVTNNPLVLPYVVVHLDLKGTPLKLPYLESLLPKIKANGANSLLMEYEDMFPYEGKLVNLSAENCYKKHELKRFLNLAKVSGFEVIPLVQTFGHMEHVLKLAEFQHLREIPQHPDSICPSKMGMTVLIQDMIDQVVNFHQAIAPLKFIHVGCDEVFHLNQCQHCIKRNLSNSNIFLHHVRTVSDIVKSLSADTTVLIWDDMLRTIKPNKWIDVDYFNNVQPVCWDYSPQIKITHVNLLKYHQKFRQIWIASAFKGADGRISTFPVSSNRFLNLFNWLSFIRNYKFGGESNVYNFKGVILTGWSRYSHMDPPCELLPVAYPILIVNLLLIQKFKTAEFSIKVDKHTNFLKTFLDEHIYNTTLDCKSNKNILDEMDCKFDGEELYIALKKYTEVTSSMRKKSDDLEELGITNIEYYSKISMLNTNKVQDHITLIQTNLDQLKELENKIAKEMLKYYEKDFVTEYISFKMQYDKKVLQNAVSSLNDYLKVSTWLRRSKIASHFL